MSKYEAFTVAIKRWVLENWRFMLGLFAVWTVVNGFVIWFVKTEETVYYWDNSAYWTSAIELLQRFRLSFSEGWRIFSESFLTDYNHLPVISFVPLMDILGIGRVKFILLITNMYLLPTAFLFTWVFLRKVLNNKNTLLFVVVLSLVALFPPLLRPVLTGQIDVVGLFVIVCIGYLCCGMDFSKVSAKSILLGVLVCLLVVLRRWYSFWVLSAGVAFVITYWFASPRDIKRLINLGVNLAIAAITSASILFFVFPYLFRAYLLDYRDLYSAYMLGDDFDMLQRFVYYFGFTTIITATVGVIYVLRESRNYLLKSIVCFVSIQAILAYILFTRTQSFGPHHYYLLVPFFLISIISLIVTLVERYQVREKTIYGITVGFIILLVLGGFVVKVPGLVLGLSSPPVVRSDIPALRELAEFINTTRRPNETVYVFASSDAFNDSLFRDVLLPNEYIQGILASAHVDKRDGFPNQYFLAEYIIVADPIQTHLPNGQLVVTQPANDILTGKVRNLEKIRSFSIDNNVRLNVYKKTGPYDPEYIEELQGVFRATYPDYKNLTNIYQ